MSSTLPNGPSLVGSPPATSTTKSASSSATVSSALNAIFLPSGDHVGLRTPCTLAVFVSV